jgi:hypothetical protein
MTMAYTLAWLIFSQAPAPVLPDGEAAPSGGPLGVHRESLVARDMHFSQIQNWFLTPILSLVSRSTLVVYFKTPILWPERE